METETTPNTPAIEQSTGPVTLADLHDGLTQTASEEHEVRKQRRQEQSAEQTAERDEAEAAEHDLNEEAAEGTLELPELLQDYDSAAVAKMMEKYGLDEADLQNPKFAALVKGALDRGEEAEDAELDEEVEPETDEPEKQEAEQPKEEATNPADKLQQFHEYIQTVQQEVADPTINNPMMVEAFKNELAQCFDAESPEAKQSIDRLANVALIGAHNLINTLVPRLIGQYIAPAIESVLPGLSQSHSEALVYNTWEDTRSSGQFGSDLPKFGTPEFYQAAERVHKANPWLENLEFRDAQGNFLPIREALKQKAEITAKLLSGEKLTPKMIAETYKKGQSHGEKSSRRVSAGRSLGAGRSTGSISQESSNFSLVDAYRERHNGGF